MKRLSERSHRLVRRGAASAAPIRAFEDCHSEGACPSLGEEAPPKDLLFADGQSRRSLAARSLRKLSSRLLGMTIQGGFRNGTALAPQHAKSGRAGDPAEAVPFRNPFMRKPRSFALLVSVLLISLLATAQAQKSSAPPAPENSELQKIKTPPLPQFHPQIPKRVVLPNGMVLLLQEDHELPLIDGTMRIRGGSLLEPADKVGLIDIYGDVWRTGGTKTKTGDQLDDFLEARAAKVETDGNADSTVMSFSCLKPDFEDVFKIFVDVLQNPAFREDKIALAKFQADTGISRRNDDIDEIARRVATQLAYGPKNPYARFPEYATVAAVTREDLIEWHQKYVHPNNIVFGVVGDFDSKAMEARIRQAFDSWPKGPEAPRPQIAFHPEKPQLYFVAKEDVNQSNIQMVSLGIERNNPDYFAVEVMNYVFGAGFSSRLVKDLRTEKGLAYAVGGGIGSAFDHPGIFRLAMGTKSATTGEAVEGLKQELQKLISDPPKGEELRMAKETILNAFIFNFDSKAKVLREQMAYEYYGYPLDFLDRYRTGIEKTTPEDVARVAKKYVHPEQFATLVVGNPEGIGKQLTALGPVEKWDITIPPPPGAKEKSAAGSQSK
jgi:zinc protease